MVMRVHLGHQFLSSSQPLLADPLLPSPPLRKPKAAAFARRLPPLRLTVMLECPAGLTHWTPKTALALNDDFVMGLSKTEVNLRRLLEAAPQRQNQAKLIHYVATLREQLEQLAEEKTNEELPRLSKATINDYSDKIEAIAAKLAVQEVESSVEISQEHSVETSANEAPAKAGDSIHSNEGLRRRFATSSVKEDGSHDTIEAEQSAPVKLDAGGQIHIQKHRKLQEDLTDEMVDLARQLKESSLLMSQSIKNTERVVY